MARCFLKYSGASYFCISDISIASAMHESIAYSVFFPSLPSVPAWNPAMEIHERRNVHTKN